MNFTRMLSLLLAAIPFLTTQLLAASCECTKRTCALNCSTKSTPSFPAQTPLDKPTPKKHPLKGIVTDILPDQSALMVKHEAIPGFMKAMTMMLTVDPAVLTTVKKGDAITGLLYRDADDTWRLDDVKVIPPAT